MRVAGGTVSLRGFATAVFRWPISQRNTTTEGQPWSQVFRRGFRVSSHDYYRNRGYDQRGGTGMFVQDDKADALWGLPLRGAICNTR